MYYCNYNSSLLLHGRNRRREATGLSDHMSEDEIPDQNHERYRMALHRPGR